MPFVASAQEKSTPVAICICSTDSVELIVVFNNSCEVVGTVTPPTADTEFALSAKLSSPSDEQAAERMMSIPAMAVEDDGVKEQVAALLVAVLTKSLDVIPLTVSLNRRRIANRRLVGE